MENCVAPGLEKFDLLLEVVLSLVRVGQDKPEGTLYPGVKGPRGQDTTWYRVDMINRYTGFHCTAVKHGELIFLVYLCL